MQTDHQPDTDVALLLTMAGGKKGWEKSASTHIIRDAEATGHLQQC